MDLKTLQLYSHLAENLHFAKTAQAMHVSPSTLSRAISRLEGELGVVLLERDNRSVHLTQAGRQFADTARQMLALWQQSQLELSPGTRLRGELRLYCSVTAAYSHLPLLLDSFRAHHPGVAIKVATGDAAEATEQVLRGRADLAIAAHPDSLPEKLAFTSLGPVPLAIIAPTMGCPVRTLITRDPIDWQAIPFILPEHGPARRRIESWWQQLALSSPNIYATVAGHEAIVSMVAVGYGIGIAPEVVIEHSPMRERVEKLAPSEQIAPFDLGLCCLKRRLSDPLIEAFWSIL